MELLRPFCGWCELYSPMCHSRERGRKRKPTKAEKTYIGVCLVDDHYCAAYKICTIPVERAAFAAKLLRAYRMDKLVEQSGVLWEGDAS